MAALIGHVCLHRPRQSVSPCLYWANTKAPGLLPTSPRQTSGRNSKTVRNGTLWQQADPNVIGVAKGVGLGWKAGCTCILHPEARVLLGLHVSDPVVTRILHKKCTTLNASWRFPWLLRELSYLERLITRWHGSARVF